MIDKILGSFDNSKNGFSARKLTAFSLMLCVGYLHVLFVDKDNVVEVMIIDLLTVLLLLGIITIQNVIELKNGYSANKKSSQDDKTDD